MEIDRTVELAMLLANRRSKRPTDKPHQQQQHRCIEDTLFTINSNCPAATLKQDLNVTRDDLNTNTNPNKKQNLNTNTNTNTNKNPNSRLHKVLLAHEAHVAPLHDGPTCDSYAEFLQGRLPELHEYFTASVQRLIKSKRD
jgi:hypothetical protein